MTSTALSPAALLGLVPALYYAVALWPADANQRVDRLRRLGEVASAASLALAAVAALLVTLGGAESRTLLPLLPFGSAGALALSFRADPITVVMVALVAFVAWAIVRFSRRYLDGDPGRARYFRWLATTLGSASLVVVSNNLLLTALAWTGVSLSLHRLLSYYGDRPQAVLAAHKKFLLSRLADALILVSVLLLGSAAGSLEIDQVVAAAGGWSAVPRMVEVAGVLLAGGVVLRSAQLPFHGWLIQAMEAPTPVSALLHAGVVNVGGFLLIRLGGLIGRLELATVVLVVVGTVTAVVAALIMTTRVSIKVSLAWSTCAQMGFMLMQIGLGWYGAAFLHLVAHSLYKAHAFLSSGSAVADGATRRLLPPEPSIPGRHWALAGGVAIGSIILVTRLSGLAMTSDPAWWAANLILAVALTPLVARALMTSGLGLGARVAVLVLVVWALNLAWHAAVEAMVGSTSSRPWLAGFVLIGFMLLYVVQGVLEARPAGGLARALYPRLFAGLHLDELFTRSTLRLWPVRVTPVGTASVDLSPASEGIR